MYLSIISIESTRATDVKVGIPSTYMYPSILYGSTADTCPSPSKESGSGVNPLSLVLYLSVHSIYLSIYISRAPARGRRRWGRAARPRTRGHRLASSGLGLTRNPLSLCFISYIYRSIDLYNRWCRVRGIKISPLSNYVL